MLNLLNIVKIITAFAYNFVHLKFLWSNELRQFNTTILFWDIREHLNKATAKDLAFF